MGQELDFHRHRPDLALQPGDLVVAGVAVPVQLLSMAPYLATIIVLVIISARHKYAGGGGTAPGSLGRPFHALR